MIPVRTPIRGDSPMDHNGMTVFFVTSCTTMHNRGMADSGWCSGLVCDTFVSGGPKPHDKTRSDKPQHAAISAFTCFPLLRESAGEREGAGKGNRARAARPEIGLMPNTPAKTLTSGKDFWFWPPATSAHPKMCADGAQ